MLLQGNQGQGTKQVGQNLVVGVGEFSELLASELQPRYYEQAYRGQTFYTSVAAGSLTAYTGGAGGTPLLGVWNPAGTGKNLVLLQAGVAISAASSVAGNPAYRLYAGATAAITGTLTVPVSTLTLNQSGSIAKVISNTAATSSTALTYLLTLGTYYWATAASANLAVPLTTDFSGSIIIPPGTMIAVGSSIATATMTSMAADAWFIWSEVAI